MPGASTTTFALNLHAGFACRHSGACCTAGWPIPVEPDIAARIRAEQELAAEVLDVTGPLPDGAAAILRPGAHGACPFFERAAMNLCVVQRRLGHGSLPATCRHFPRVTLLEPDGVRVTLSHFCPTAASMLFREDIGTLEITTHAAGIADQQEHEGFDARHTIPPLLRPGVATDAPTCRLWEEYLIRALDADGLTPEGALGEVAESATRIRAWKAGEMRLADHVRRVLTAGADQARSRRWTMSAEKAARLFARAAASVPESVTRPAAPDGFEAADQAWVQPRWATLARPVRRYLAARAFGAWSAYLGEGLRSQVAMLAVALAVLRVEAARQAAAAARLLDETLLHAAIRSSDQLLQHTSNLGVLVESVAPVERLSSAAFLDAIGLKEVE